MLHVEISPWLADLIEDMLNQDLQKRPPASSILKHPNLKKYVEEQLLFE